MYSPRKTSGGRWLFRLATGSLGCIAASPVTGSMQITERVQLVIRMFSLLSRRRCSGLSALYGQMKTNSGRVRLTVSGNED